MQKYLFYFHITKKTLLKFRWKSCKLCCKTVFLPNIKKKVMRKYNIILLFVVILVCDSGRMHGQNDLQKWKLVFEDDFNLPYSSPPDTSKWKACQREPYLWARWINNNKDNLEVRRGHLVCRAIPNYNLLQDTAIMMTSAIRTKDKFALTYGKVEVRLRTNGNPGNFPAAWLLPVSVGNPFRYGEIDIFESFGGDGQAYQTIHSHRSQILGKQKPTSVSKAINLTQWHIYGAIWTPKSISFTLDGEVTAVYNKSTDQRILDEGQWTFDRPYYLILNQSVGNSKWNTPNTKSRYETQIDWVRMYQAQ